MKRKRFSDERIAFALRQAEIRRLEQLEEENVKLKRLVTDLSLDNRTAQKKVLRLAIRREIVAHMQAVDQISERRAAARRGSSGLLSDTNRCAIRSCHSGCG
jgi:hypothetical protein